MLINHVFNIHSNIYFKNNYTLSSCPNLYKYVKVDDLLSILHFQHDVALKCTYEFSTFKYYSRIHQTSDEKIGLNSI